LHNLSLAKIIELEEKIALLSGIKCEATNEEGETVIIEKVEDGEGGEVVQVIEESEPAWLWILVTVAVSGGIIVMVVFTQTPSTPPPQKSPTPPQEAITLNSKNSDFLIDTTDEEESEDETIWKANVFRVKRRLRAGNVELVVLP
jgi:hypothetical protein